MDKKQQFIYTMEKSIADRLIKQNFTLLSDNNGNYIFMNNGVLTFESDEDEEKRKEILTKMAYTNVLCF